MPIYEFKCEKCETVFETIVSLNSTEEILCENCGSNEVQKLLSTMGIKVSQGSSSSSPPPSCQARGGFT